MVALLVFISDVDARAERRALQPPGQSAGFGHESIMLRLRVAKYSKNAELDAHDQSS